MLLGGLGLVIAAVLFFSWRKSEKGWQRAIAGLAVLWGIASIIVYLAVTYMAANQ